MSNETELHVNGCKRRLSVDPNIPLIYVLRNELNLKGTRFGCGNSECGACTVLVNNVAQRSCDIPVWSVGRQQRVVTIEGLDGVRLSRLQQSFLDHQAGQCAYCVSGVIMSAAALLMSKPAPTASDIRHALNRNLCRCGSHARMLAAVAAAAGGET